MTRSKPAALPHADTLAEFPTFSAKECAVFRAVIRLAEGGADLTAVRVQEIADAAGMGKGTLYEYFKSKEAILHGTMAYCIAGELANIEAFVTQSETFSQMIDLALAYVATLVHTRVAAYQLIGEVLRMGRKGKCAALPELELAKAKLAELTRQGWRLAVQSGVDEELGEEYYNFVTVTAFMGCAGSECRLLFDEGLTCEKQAALEANTRQMLYGALGLALR